MSPPPASKKANVVQFAAGAAVDGSGSAAAKIKARAQFSDDGTSSSAAIAEDRSVKSHYVLNSVIDVALGKSNLGEEEEEEAGEAEGKAAIAAEEQQQPPRPTSKASKSRMETYKAEWAEGAAGAERPLLPEDVERWREEKARRMVAWINSSQLTGYWGSETPWWKVMLREVEAMQEQEQGAGERGRKAMARSRALKDLVAAFEENATEDDAAAAAATMSFFDSLNVVEHGGGDGEGANDAVDCGGAAAKGTIHKGRPH